MIRIHNTKKCDSFNVCIHRKSFRYFPLLRCMQTPKLKFQNWFFTWIRIYRQQAIFTTNQDPRKEKMSGKKFRSKISCQSPFKLPPKPLYNFVIGRTKVLTTRPSGFWSFSLDSTVKSSHNKQFEEKNCKQF